MKAKTNIRPWHPDLRNLDTLPDTKVVRTDFLVNAIAITCLAFTAYLASQVYSSTSEVEASIRSVESKVESLQSNNVKFMAQDKEYREVAKILQEFNQLNENELGARRVIHEITQLVPDQAVLESLVFEESFLDKPKGKGKAKLAEKASFNLSATGYIAGSSMEAYAILNEMKKKIGEISIWRDSIDELELKSMGYSRNQEQLPFSLKLITK